MQAFLRLVCFGILLAANSGQAAENPFVGRWAFTLPDGRGGWLGVEDGANGLSASLLWGGGSVLPIDEVKLAGETLHLTRTMATKNAKRKQVISAQRQEDMLALTLIDYRADGKAGEPSTFTAQRLADLPPRPDLTKVKYDEPIALIAKDELAGWEVVKDDTPNGWSVANGVLSNHVRKTDGVRFANLKTKQQFADFRLTTDVRVPPGGNGGVYLRGMYEIQIADSFGKPLDSHNQGALYSRITPSASAEKPADEWQTLDITLVDQHVTVILNGTTIIDNQPVLGCTGGAMTSEDSSRGPLMLQGDHTDVEFRNMTVRPVQK